MINDLLKFKSFKAYDESINDFIKKPAIMIPFIISSIIPLITVFLSINLIGGNELTNYYYNSNEFIITQSLQTKLFIALTIAGVISSILIGLFDSIGLSMCNNISRASIHYGWVNGLKHWLKMIITLLSLMLIGIILIYPALIIITIGLGVKAYITYTMIGVITFILLSLYPRIITINEKIYGFKAIIKGLRLILMKPLHVITNLLIIGIILFAFSIILIFSPTMYYIINTSIVIPWINLFLVKSYKLIK